MSPDVDPDFTDAKEWGPEARIAPGAFGEIHLNEESKRRHSTRALILFIATSSLKASKFRFQTARARKEGSVKAKLSYLGFSILKFYAIITIPAPETCHVSLLQSSFSKWYLCLSYLKNLNFATRLKFRRFLWNYTAWEIRIIEINRILKFCICHYFPRNKLRSHT